MQIDMEKNKNNPINVTMRVTDRVIDRRVLLEASTLVENGYKVTVIAGPVPIDLQVLEKEVWNGVKIFWLKDRSTKYLLKIERFLNRICRFPRHNPLSFIGRFIFRKILKSHMSFPGTRKRSFNRSSSFSPETGMLLLTPFLLLEYAKQIFQEMFLLVRRRIIFWLHRKLYITVAKICDEEKPDICHAHDLVTLEEMYNISKQHQSKFVYDSHEFYTEIRTLTSSQKEHATQLEANLIKKTDLVITINDSIAEAISRKYDIPKPLTIMNCARNIENNMNQNRYYLHNKLHLDKSVGIILYQGNLTPGRGLDVFVESARYLNKDNIKLVLLGNEGTSGYRKELLDIVKKYSLKDKVVFLNGVHQDKLLYCTISARIGVIPYPPVDLNTYYCTPNKLFEYIVAHVPVLSNDLPELRKIVSENNIGIATDLSTPEKMAQAISEMHENEEQYDQFKKNLVSVSKRLNWENESRKLIEGYDLLFQGSKKC